MREDQWDNFSPGPRIERLLTNTRRYCATAEAQLYENLCRMPNHEPIKQQVMQPLSWRSVSRFTTQPEIVRCQLPGLSLFLHGSHADHTAIEYSDVDLVAILWADALRSLSDFRTVVAGLRDATLMSLKQDPLQHHVPKVIYAGTELSSPSTTWLRFPPLFCEDLILVGGDDPHAIPALGSPSRAALAAQLQSVLLMLRGLSRLNPCLAYNAKALVSTVLLLPVVLVQCEARLISKAESFTAYQGSLCQVVELASMLRAQWSYSGKGMARGVRRCFSFQQGANFLRHLPLIDIAPTLRNPVRELHGRIPEIIGHAQREGGQHLSKCSEQ
jgi:hypothetical protein